MNFPKLEQVLELQRSLIDEFGGRHGIINQSMLESAIGRPQTGYYEDLHSMAAALIESIIQNHPFVDGNKRTGLSLTATFLQMNGYRLIVSSDDGEKFVEDIAKKEVDFKCITAWLEDHTKKC